MLKWTQITEKLAGIFLIKNQPEYHKIRDEDLLRQARDELHQARSLFSEALDTQMIDSAIFRLMAAEIRFDYLLKNIKEEKRQWECKAADIIR